MNKPELVAAIADKAGLSKRDADKALTAFSEVVGNTLAGGDKVIMVGFGTFEVRERAARRGRNPQTGEEIDIAAGRVPAFKAGKVLREAVEK